MPTFHWTGKTVKGQEISGKMEAAFKDEVVRALQAQKISIISVTEKNRSDMTTQLESSATQPTEQKLGRIVWILLLILGICMCIGLIWRFIR
jgi:type II secretory pathway component PulF